MIPIQSKRNMKYIQIEKLQTVQSLHTTNTQERKPVERERDGEGKYSRIVRFSLVQLVWQATVSNCAY